MTLEEEIAAAESRRYAATLRADEAALRECLGQNLLYVHSNAVVEDRETYIGKIVSGEYKYLAFRPGNRIVRRFGTAATCTGDLEVEGVKGPVRVIYTVVYENDGGWKLVHWHSCTRPA